MRVSVIDKQQACVYCGDGAMVSPTDAAVSIQKKPAPHRTQSPPGNIFNPEWSIVMTGHREGVFGQFLRHNPRILNNHCSAHRLALCSEQATKSIPQIKHFQETLELIYTHFKYAKKIDAVSEIQELLGDPILKYWEIHQIRWLSCYEALDTVFRTLDSLITYLTTAAATGDNKAEGLKRNVVSVQFISLIFLMMDPCSTTCYGTEFDISEERCGPCCHQACSGQMSERLEWHQEWSEPPQ